MTDSSQRDTVHKPVPSGDRATTHDQRQAALAGLAFASADPAARAMHTQSRHLAFLPPETLDLDLSNPAHRDFGDYELTEKLGQGGMGVVYRARQKSLDRDVALKLLAAGPWASNDFIERFRREAQSAARMQHPNIVPIYEIGAHDELNYFSMALVRGPTVAQVLAQQGPFEPRAAAQLLRTIAEAVHYAHRLGVLHLDLKPGNVLIDERGVPLVADFGLARRIDETLAADNDQISGTPSYMAPEQAQVRSHRLSPATDIYGLGAILYELLTGRPPFLAATPQETLKRVIATEAERPHRLRRTIPLDLEAVALKCLAKEPKARYASAQALAEDLGRYIEGRAVSVRPLNTLQRAARWARREPRVAFAVGAFVFALVSGLVATAVQWRRADANAVAARDGTWVLRAQAAQAVLTEGDGFAALRPLLENLREMEAAGRDADALVQRQRIGALLANAPRLLDYRAVPGKALVFSLAVSPDGERYALGLTMPAGERLVKQYEVASGRELWSTPTVGLTFALPLPGSMPHGDLAYSPDGSRLVARLQDQSPFPAPRTADGLAFDVRDGRVLTPPDEGRKHLDIVYSEDARVAMVRYRSDPSFRFPDGAQFYAVEPWQALGPRQVIGGSIGADMWLPTTDGRWFLGSSDFTTFTLFERGTLKVRWRLQLPADDKVLAWRFNSDASRLALGTMAGAVYLVDTRDASYQPLRSTPSSVIRWLEFGSDGRVLAATAEDGTIVAWDVASLKPLTTPLQGAGQGLPRGRVIDGRIYAAGDNQLRMWTLPPLGPYDNVAVPAVARVRTQRQMHVDGFDVHPASRLLVVGGTEGAVSLWRLPPPVLLPARAAPLPPRRIAYDGERIVAVEGTQVQLREPFGDAPRSVAWQHPDPVRMAELSADGRRLVTVAGRTVRVFDPATGAAVGAPLVLPQSPLRVDLARTAPVLVLTTGEYQGDTFRERVHVVDLEQATLRPVEAFLPFVTDDFQLDPGGNYLLARHVDLATQTGGLLLVRLDGTASRCERFQPEAMNHPGDVAIADDGRSAWVYVFGLERSARVERWDLGTCALLRRIDVQAGRTDPRLIAVGDDVVVHRQSGDGLSRFGADGSRHDAPGSSVPGASGAFALSRDGRRAAVATHNAVQLIDIARGERLSAPLAAPIAGNDALMTLAFSPDASQLVARTVRGRWLAWRLPVSRLDTTSLATLAALLDPTTTAAPPTADAIAALRSDMQAHMPEQEPAAAVPAQSTVLPPAPGSESDPRFVPLDLGPAINAPLNGNWPGRNTMGGDQPTMAFGPLRLLGIDWRVDGGVQLSWGGPAGTLHPTQRASTLVPVADVVARRLHLLMLMHVFIQPNLAPFPAAHVVLIGADGRETVLTPMMVRDVVPHWTPDRAAPGARIGWLGLSGTNARSGTAPPAYDSHTFAVSLDVPADVGPIRGLRLESREGPMELPLFYAVTLETASAPNAGVAQASPR